MAHTGGCLCSAIRYAVDAPLAELRECHCTDCQHASGSHGAVVAFVRAQNFRLLRGTPKRYAKQADSGRTLMRYFCGECGSSLYSHRELVPGVIGVRAGTLDDSASLRITAHIWTKSAPPWSYIDPAAQRVAGQPEALPKPAAQARALLGHRRTLSSVTGALMNKDQAKGHMKDLAGKLRAKLGSLTGNRKEQAKGLANQAEGKLQKGVGDLKNIANKGKEQ
jgi:uncharacterized protein YjbJ (UPF0337 family)